MISNNNCDGLEIGEAQFKRLNLKEQNLLLFKNSLAAIKLIKSYKLHQKIQYVILSGFGVVLGMLINMHIR